MSDRPEARSSAGRDVRHGSDPLDARHLGPESLRRYLAANGLRPNRRFSQNFLADGEVLEAIVEAAALEPGDADRAGVGHRQVLEIGPGIGILTGALLEAGAAVVAVEVDPRMVEHLRRRFAAAIGEGRLRLIHDDILQRAVGDVVGSDWDLVANLPYHITSPILHHVLGDEPRPGRFVLMLQREVAERIAAPPGGMSYLSVFVQYHARVSVLRLVPADRLRAGAGGRFRGPRRGDRAAAARRGRGGGALAARPGRLPRAPQDAPQRPAPPAAVARPRAHRDGPRDLRDRARPPAADGLRRRVAGPRRGPRPAGRPGEPGVSEALARAKVNLALGIVGRRPDGYHELVSVFARLDLADRLSVEPAADGDRLEVVGGPIAYRPADDDLVLRAAGLLREARDPQAPGLAFRLEKHVPLAAGLAGGSADAAAALDLAARTWGIELAADERLALAARLGSDVPFLAADVDAALVTGRGEHVEPLPGPLDPVGVLLATVGAGLSTRDVFAARAASGAAAVDTGTDDGAGRMPAADRARELAARLARGSTAADLVSAATALRDANDLWAASIALRPDLAGARDGLEARLGRPVLLSGSGPTLFALYPSTMAAETAAAALRAAPVPGLAPAAIRVATFGRTTTREAR